MKKTLCSPITTKIFAWYTRVIPKPLCIEELWIYPVKSCQGISVPRIKVTKFGFEWDRNWMIVDDKGKFVTQRTEEKMALLTIRFAPTIDRPAYLVLYYPGFGEVSIDLKNAEPKTKVSVTMNKGYETTAYDEGDKVAKWLEFVFQKKYRLVRLDVSQDREVKPDITKSFDDGQTKFFSALQDDYHVTQFSQASAADLSAQLGMWYPMESMRSNIKTNGYKPYEEEAPHITTFGSGVSIWWCEPSKRCKMITVNQRTGKVFSQKAEPTKTIVSYKKSTQWDGARFCMNGCVIDGVGKYLNVGDRFLITGCPQ